MFKYRQNWENEISKQTNLRTLEEILILISGFLESKRLGEILGQQVVPNILNCTVDQCLGQISL